MRPTANYSKAKVPNDDDDSPKRLPHSDESIPNKIGIRIFVRNVKGRVVNKSWIVTRK